MIVEQFTLRSGIFTPNLFTLFLVPGIRFQQFFFYQEFIQVYNLKQIKQLLK